MTKRAVESLQFVPREIRLQHAKNLEDAGIEPFPQETPEITHSNVEILDRADELKGRVVRIVGRITARRNHGGITFYDLEDNLAKVQTSIQKDDFPPEKYDLMTTNYDDGDFVYAQGSVYRTKRGEITVRAKELAMLAKAVLPPPSERFGISDPEIARKQRYLELMTNPRARERFRLRARMTQLFREELQALGALEVETPILDTVYGGAFAKPFITHIDALDQDMFLRISPELYLKRLILGGLGPVFEISRNFRNEGMDRTHNPEFTLLEAYFPHKDYNWMMQIVEKIFERIAIDLHGTTKVKSGEYMIDYKAPWRRLSIYDGLREVYGIDPKTISDEEFQSLGKKMQVAPRYNRRGDILLALFEKYFDDKLIQPTFVIDYPRETSPLTKKHRNDPDLVERFECVIGNLEVMNCYTELNDPRDQRRRFDEERIKRLAGDSEAMPTDEDFLVAMEYGMPPMAGIGISIDRMAMLLTMPDVEKPHIRDIILFPPHKKYDK